jgi:glycine/D-amino acid oxidase-like deaminating enzyme
MTFPESARFVVIGAGVHGLSTAWHLAKELEASGRGSGADVVVLDKTGVGAGPSGIACGVIRNNYFQPAMRELMAHSVAIWESDPEAFHYHPVGYLQIAPDVMAADVAQIHAEQRAIGYRSQLIEGEDDCRRHMEGIFSDWQAKNVTAVLHEGQGGYAENLPSMMGLRAKSEALGVRLHAPVAVAGFEVDGGAVTRVQTDRGDIACDSVVVAAGPWVRDFWHMLDMPSTTVVRGADGIDHALPTWTYCCLQEGTLGVDPTYLLDNEGNMPPVVHIDTDAPLFDDADGSLVTDQLWGVYYKPDFNFGGVQGGAMPWVVEQDADDVAVDPYGPRSTEYVVTEEFERMWTSALAHCHKRFEGTRGLYQKAPTGGIGAFSPDSFPIFDTFRENAFVVADSNHGYKMIGVGALVAKEVMGEPQTLLEPFRYSRFTTGDLHPVSNSPYPWS